MAVLNMCHFQLCALQKDRPKILSDLQMRGSVEIKDTESPNTFFFKADTKKQFTQFQKSAETAAAAVKILDAIKPREKPALAFLQGRKAVTSSEWEEIAKQSEESVQLAQRIVELNERIQSTKTEIALCETQEAILTVWQDLPVAENYTGSKRTAVFIGSLPGEKNADSITDLIGTGIREHNSDIPFYVEVVFRSAEQTNFFVLGLKTDQELLEQILRSLGFVRPAQVSDTYVSQDESGCPAARLTQLQNKRMTLHASLAENQKEIEDLHIIAERLEHADDYFTTRAEKYAVIQQMTQTGHTFILEGYVLERDAQSLKKMLEGAYSLSFEITDTGSDPDAPVCLNNSGFARALTGVLESYSLPGKGEIDPLPVMSFFYYLTFGIMFSDAGYGLIMAAACGFCLWKYKNMDQNWKNSLRMFFFCGLSTILWGVVFSSYFGDVVDVVSRTFFGRQLSIPPVWFAPIQQPMLMLIFCLAIGVVHLTVGYGIKGLSHIRQGRFLDAVFDALFPLGLIYPLLVMLTGSEMFYGMAGFRIYLNASANDGLLYASLFCMAGILLTGGRENKNFAIRLVTGLYALYNLLAGWISDILSYSRLLGLGLAAGVIASVMNQLGSMGGKSPVGILLFIVVFLVGQSLNFAINALGAYVHSNRLEYVEFFGKFYEGGGRKFSPFALNTKHIKPFLEN